MRIAALSILLACALVGACARAPARSTRLTVGDVEVMASEMAGNLRSSSFLAGRSPESMPMVIAVSKVENLSSDLLSEGEKWYIVDRVFDAEAMQALRRQRSITFVIPAEKLRLFRDNVPEGGSAAIERRPTHTVTATMRSLTRSAGDQRTELYDIEFRIVALDDGEIVWSDHYALKRAAVGRQYN